MDFKKRSEMHLTRKLWHMVTVSLMILAYHLLPPAWSSGILVGSCLLFIPIDFLRLRHRGLNDFVLHLFRPVVRQNEVNALAGTTYLLCGVLIVYILFPRTIVFLTLLYLAFADPIASVVGIRFGKDKLFGNKSLQGSAAAFFVCSAITYFVLHYKGVMVDRVGLVSLLGGLIGAIAEGVPIGKLDDNLSMPIVSAVGLWLLFFVFGGLSLMPTM